MLEQRRQTGRTEEFAGQTTVHPVGLTALLALCVAALLVPRRYVPLAFLCLALLIPSAQRVVLANFDFSFVRIIILVIVVRMLARGEFRSFGRLMLIDVVLIVWAAWSIVASALLHGTVDASVTRAGYLLDALGAYAIGRVYMQHLDMNRRLVGWLTMIAVPVFLSMMFERSTGRNLFAGFGGVPEQTFLRQGRLRCQGPFSHPIMAGVVWASFLPLFAAAWMTRLAPKTLLVIAGGLVLGIVVNTASSTPVMAALLSGLFVAMFLVNSWMRAIQIGSVGLLLLLSMVMNAPVWHLIARVNVVGGSTGWHRYHLIDKAIENIGEWYAFGTLSTGHWGYGLQDVTNQYILEGVRGGVLQLGLFTVILALCFVCVSRVMRSGCAPVYKWWAWAYGTVIAVHAFNFIAVSYFGQAIALLFLQIGSLVAFCEMAAKSQAIATTRTSRAAAAGRSTAPRRSPVRRNPAVARAGAGRG